ncbi:GNAT family N-acetyltransferase [Saccharicrinis aurantiacus]|uniref:GNAT family N-acetyltransferase n=1 Tax=Saccharicrinis aurantiacus TaxID=1849719 RepID=UPI0024919846|nr:GNAT family N-acetyltransferase [Saccharicrinis aurantiacus]
MELVKIDINTPSHQAAIIELMNDYMLDEMGLGAPMKAGLAEKIIAGLKEQPNYLGFLYFDGKEFVALANCFVAFSTFKAKQLFNIHDYVVHQKYRGKGYGRSFLKAIKDYGAEHDFCKITLEVRHDNPKAQGLYKSLKFEESNPPMYFWSAEL